MEAVGTIPITAVLYSNMLAQIRGTVHHIWLPGATKNKKLKKYIEYILIIIKPVINRLKLKYWNSLHQGGRGYYTYHRGAP